MQILKVSAIITFTLRICNREHITAKKARTTCIIHNKVKVVLPESRWPRGKKKTQAITILWTPWWSVLATILNQDNNILKLLEVLLSNNAKACWRNRGTTHSELVRNADARSSRNAAKSAEFSIQFLTSWKTRRLLSIRLPQCSASLPTIWRSTAQSNWIPVSSATYVT